MYEDLKIGCGSVTTAAGRAAPLTRVNSKAAVERIVASSILDSRIWFVGYGSKSFGRM